MLQPSAHDLGRLLREVNVPHPPAGKACQLVPASDKWELEDYAQYTVVVILDLSLEPLATLEDESLQRLVPPGAAGSGQIPARDASAGAG